VKRAWSSLGQMTLDHSRLRYTNKAQGHQHPSGGGTSQPPHVGESESYSDTGLKASLVYDDAKPFPASSYK